MADSGSILVLNSGSSSLKLGVYAREGDEEQAVCDALVEDVGQPKSTLTVRDVHGSVVHRSEFAAATQTDALQHGSEQLAQKSKTKPIAIGHRVVHSGPHLTEHQLITPQLISELEAAIHFAPLHIPASLGLIAECSKAYPAAPQFACFDTVFHRTMPEVSARFPLPSHFFNEGIRRYGFHGLSCESILHQLGDKVPARMIIAHLGSGSSVTAVQDGRSVDTSMGLTPTGGIPMSARTGDLDPGVLLFLLRTGNFDADSLERLLNRESGLRALSGGDTGMKEIEQRAKAGDAQAALAFAVFCRSLAKFIAGYAATMGGLDLLVFAGGIGEHSAAVRSRVCESLSVIGINLDVTANTAGKDLISSEASTSHVRVIPSEEDKQIARHCRRLLQR